MNFVLLVAEGTEGAEAPQGGGFDWTMLILLGALGLMMFFMFRNNKKRKQQAEEVQEKIQVGVDVMTSFGLFGTVQDVDDENNIVFLETGPGQVIRVHRQVVTTVVEPNIPDDASDLSDNSDEESDTDK